MSILEQINQDFQQAFKNRETSTISTLRLVLAAAKNERIKKMADLQDEDIIRVLKSEVKKRKESISDFQKGERPDLVANEEAEIKIIEKYLPATLSEEDLRQKIKAILQGAEDKENLGKVIGLVMKDLKGTADGSLVRKIVEEELNK
ncbi:MAG: GatB/YqeY domain-containing protein [Patescibacteria group bacterium]